MWFHATKFQDDVELKNEVVGIVAGSSTTKIERKRKLLQTFNEGGITPTPNTPNISSSIDPPKLVAR